jgi:23S rRNA pseudouridine1911/1915/1917 synthase
MSNYIHIVTESEQAEDLTINQILRRNFKFSSRFKTKIKYQKLVDLNGEQTPGFIRPHAGDTITVRLPEETSDFPAEDIPVHTLYEDEDLLVIDKQPGITVHPTKGHPSHTLANGIMKYMEDTNQSFKIRFANRLDMDTSGIVIVAKNANTQNGISQQMRAQSTVKKYRAVVHGNITEDTFTIHLPIGRPAPDEIRRCVLEEGGKDAITDVKVLAHYGENYTLVELTLKTGRTHQIRVHLSHIGHPIVGDELYGGEDPHMDRQALHSCYLEFTHPMTDEILKIQSELPTDIMQCIEEIEKETGI